MWHGSTSLQSHKKRSGLESLPSDSNLTIIQLLNKTRFFLTLILISSSLVSIHYTKKKTYRNRTLQINKVGRKIPKVFFFHSYRHWKLEASVPWNISLCGPSFRTPCHHTSTSSCVHLRPREHQKHHTWERLWKGDTKVGKPPQQPRVRVPREPLRLSVSCSAYWQSIVVCRSGPVLTDGDTGKRDSAVPCAMGKGSGC